MKNVVTAAALVALTASSAMANMGSQNTTWNGTTGTLFSDKCEFIANVPGSMTYDIATGVWTTGLDKATVVVKTRNVDGITAEATDSKLYKSSDNSEVGAVTIDYMANGTAITGPAGMTVNINSNGISATDIDQGGSAYTNVNVTLAGTATMNNTDVETNGLEENESYYVSHTVTCLQ